MINPVTFSNGCWGTALTRLYRNLGPQPWSCPGHLMHPANSLALSSNPHCCPCPWVREWRKALGWSSNPQEPAGIWQGGLGHNIILLCLLSAQRLCFSSVSGHATALELPCVSHMKLPCEEKHMTVCPGQFWYCLGQGSHQHWCSKFHEGFANISLKGAQLFSIQTCFLIHSIIPYQAGTLYSQSCQTHEQGTGNY